MLVRQDIHLMNHGTQGFTLTAQKAGTATITVTATDMSDATAFTEVKGSKTVTITVKEQTTQNNQATGDASLKSITIAGKTYNNPKTDMTINVDASVDSAEVSAVANVSSSKITGTGVKELATGTNTVKITVTAARWNKKNI